MSVRAGSHYLSLMCAVLSGGPQITKGAELVESFEILRAGKAYNALTGVYVSDYIGKESETKKYTKPQDMPDVFIKVGLKDPEQVKPLEKGFYIKSVSEQWKYKWRRKTKGPAFIKPDHVDPEAGELGFKSPRTYESEGDNIDALWNMKENRGYLVGGPKKAYIRNIRIMILKGEKDSDSEALLILEIPYFEGRERPGE